MKYEYNIGQGTLKVNRLKILIETVDRKIIMIEIKRTVNISHLDKAEERISE